MTHERWVPFTGPARPLPAIAKGELADQARALWTEVENRRNHAAAVEEARRNAEQAAQAAHQALEAERARAAEAAEVSTLDAQLLAKRDQLVAEASAEIHSPRKHAAAGLVAQAENDYLDFLRQNADELAKALRADADKVAVEFRKVQDENQTRLRPIEQRHAELRDAFHLILGGDMRFRVSDLPEGVEFHKSPFPTEAFERIAHEEQREAAERAAAQGLTEV